jgi:predicted ATP-grasp superfamily ATP-dependent carboligase
MLAKPDSRVGIGVASALPLAVVVGGADNGGGLGVVRSLGAAGVPIAVLDAGRSASALYSRYVQSSIIVELSGRPLIDALASLAAGQALKPVLFLTTDDAVWTVSRYRDELGGYRIRLPEHSSLPALMSKAGFQGIAEARGFPVPRAVLISSASEIANLARLTFPAVAKPSDKTPAYLAQGFARGYRLAALTDAQRLCETILPTLPDLLVQEWIEGSEEDIYFCLQYRGESGAIASFTGRKLSIWPPDVGTTASCLPAPEAHEVLSTLTNAFFEAVSFVGMGSMEFKRDARTGRFFMIEPTVGRVDWQEEVATLNGVNIPLAAYCHEIGVPLPSSPVTTAPVVWRDSGRHWKAMRFARHRALPPDTRVVDAYWRRNDPMPALAHVLGTLMRLVRRAVQRP